MKKKLTLLIASLLMPFAMALSACETPNIDNPLPPETGGEVVDPEPIEEPVVIHDCHSLCFDCGGCQDSTCTDPACAKKCTCNVPVVHDCHNLCFDCGGCKDLTCTNAACATKCSCKTPTVHTCSHVCPLCGKCNDLACTDTVCSTKCTCNQTTPSVHTCSHVCTTCGKCLDYDCTNTVCSNKCTGHTSIQGDSTWKINTALYGVSFRNHLGQLIEDKATSTTTYKKCLSIGQQAAAVGSKFVPFYHGSDYAVSTSTSCNREHTWPNSRGGGDKAGGDNIERDPFMIRPTITQDNSDRGNDYYGDPNVAINGKKYSNQWDPASCGYEPARGESARIIFYVATRYGKSNGLSLNNNPSSSSGNKSMGTLKTLMEWNAKYPPTAMEKQINNYLDSQGYGHNPFVDHPEYANMIWDTTGLLTAPYSGRIHNTFDVNCNDTNYTLDCAINDISKAVSCIYPTNI